MADVVKLTVNGVALKATVAPSALLSDFLRAEGGCKGVLVGCDTAQCGCCTVLVDGDAVKSCTMLALQADGSNVTTIEGLPRDGKLHPMQQAFHEFHALQCGYCTAGIVLNAIDIVAKHSDLSESKVRHLLEGNICRCTGYENIIDAVLHVANTNRGATA